MLYAAAVLACCSCCRCNSRWWMLLLLLLFWGGPRKRLKDVVGVDGAGAYTHKRCYSFILMPPTGVCDAGVRKTAVR